jgi:hypothetical protein
MPEAGGVTYHGEKINDAKAKPVSKLPKIMEKKGGLDHVKVEGEVLACCQAKGCWMTMSLDESTEMRIRFKDYGFFVPLDAGGKIAVIEGNAYYDTTSVADLRHYAVDGGMSKEEAAKKYTEPEVAISFEATGVMLKPKEE